MCTEQAKRLKIKICTRSLANKPVDDDDDDDGDDDGDEIYVIIFCLYVYGWNGNVGQISQKHLDIYYSRWIDRSCH